MDPEFQKKLTAQIEDAAAWMDVILSLHLSTLQRNLNSQIIELKYGRGYQEEFMDNLLLDVMKI